MPTYFLDWFSSVLALQWGTLTLSIDSDDPEVILGVNLQVWHCEVCGGAIYAASLGPRGPGVWSHLDDVRGQRGSSITLRSLPLQVSRVLCHVVHCKWSCRLGWFFCDKRTR